MFKKIPAQLRQLMPGTLKVSDNTGEIFIFLALAAVSILTRLIFMGWMDLLPEEAYYWNYAQHLDYGYLDHPPMVAGLIWLSTSILGNNEFAVRLPAFIGWFVFAFFIFRFTSNMINQKAAYWSVILIALLPIYFSIGFMMTPDAPMYIAWAGCLYFLERSLFSGKKTAWLGFGICLGLGFLSKYSIGLLDPAVIVFLILDKKSRVWWRRPEPYGAALLALAILSPVLIWNYQNQWISFVFQGPRRWSGGFNFSLHLLIGGALVLLTPVGLIEAFRSLMRNNVGPDSPVPEDQDIKRKRRFMLVFALVPLLVFVINSLRSQPKLNWTGVVWLAILPLIAAELGKLTGKQAGLRNVLKRSWTITLVALVILYPSGMSYIGLGMPGVQTSGLPLPTAWEEFYQEVEVIESGLENRIRTEPLVVGMDKYWTVSQLAFYGAEDKDSPYEYAGRHLFDENSLMWNYWVPRQDALDKTIIIMSFDKDDLEKASIISRFKSIGPIQSELIHKKDNILGRFYWRVGYNYRG